MNWRVYEVTSEGTQPLPLDENAIGFTGPGKALRWAENHIDIDMLGTRFIIMRDDGRRPLMNTKSAVAA